MEESQVEGEPETVKVEEIDEDPLKLPVDLTEPVFRWGIDIVCSYMPMK